MLVRTTDEAEALLRWLGERRFVLAFDTETTGFEWDSQLRLVQFGDTQQGFAIPWDSPAAAVVQRVVSEYRGRVVAHNAKFDLHRLELHGVDVSPWLGTVKDTDLMARVLAPAEMSFKLKQLAKRHLGIENDPEVDLKAFMRGRPLMDIQRALKEDDDWGESVLRSGEPVRAVRRGLGTALQEEARRLQAAETFTWETVPLDTPQYIDYAVNDCLITSKLYTDWLYPLLMNNPWAREVIEFEHEVQQVLYRMEAKGLLVDPGYTARLQHQWEQELAVLGEWFHSMGVENPNSNEEVAAKLQELGWAPAEFTETGKVKLDSDIKAELALDYEMAAKLQQWGRLTKWKSSYVDHFLADRDHNDRIHASLHTIGARTSRMSVSAPPLQQLPSGDATVRDCVVAPEGYSLVAVDYSAIEMRVAASEARERALMDAFEQGVNPHMLTASLVYGDHVTKDGPEYKLSKVVNYASLYGATARAIAIQAGVRKPVAQDFLDRFFSVYPGLRNYMNGCQALARKQGYIELPSGRQLPVDHGHWYAATNYAIQGYAAEVLKRAVLRLRDGGLTDYMVVPVHDEILFETPESEAKDVMRLAEDIMYDDALEVPLTTEGTVCGDRWGHKYRHEETA